MTMSRKSIRQQMQEHRPTRKRQLYEVAPSPPKKQKLLTGDSPSSSPSKGPLVDNSDDESLPSFRTKSFYSSKKLMLPKSPGSAESPSSFHAEVAAAKTSSRSVTRMSGRTPVNKGNTCAGGKSKRSRVALSPIKNVYNSIGKQPKAKPVSKVNVNHRRSKSAPPKVKLNVETVLPRKPQNSPAVSSTPDNNRKFFKHKSPGSASKATGGIIVGKGFNLKFIPGSLNGQFSQTKRKKAGISAKQDSVKKTQKKYSRTRSFSKIEPVVKNQSQGESNFSEEASDHNASIHNSLETTPTSSTVSGMIFDEEPESLASESLFTSDTQSLASDVSRSVVCSPASVSTLQSDLSSPNGRRGKKFYSIFFKGQRNQPGIESSLSTTKGSTPKDSPVLKRLTTIKGDNKQLALDAGQRHWGATQCKVCAMVYTPSDATDEATHASFHERALASLKFPGWKKERVIKDFLDDGSRVIVVLPEDHRFMMKKVEEVNRVMGKELGFPDQTFSFHGSYKAFLYISDEKRVEGCCIAEPITQGYRILPGTKDVSDSQRPWFCSSIPEPAAVGIGRLWVYGPSRKRGIASRLLDCIRQWFEYGIFLSKSQLAFSDPTPDGRRFAAKYTGTHNFLVYRYNH